MTKPNEYRLIYSPAALEDIRELRMYIAGKADRRTAALYIRRLKEFCKELETAPHIGEHRSGLAAEQKSVGFEHRVSVVFTVDSAQGVVSILQFDYAGRQGRRTH